MDLRNAFEPPVPAVVLADGAFGRPAGKPSDFTAVVVEPMVADVAEDRDLDLPVANVYHANGPRNSLAAVQEAL